MSQGTKTSNHVVVKLKIPTEIHHQLKVFAVRRGVSLHDTCIESIADYLQRNAEAADSPVAQSAA